MAALVAAIAILGVVVVLQTGGGGPMRSLPSMRVLRMIFRKRSKTEETSR